VANVVLSFASSHFHGLSSVALENSPDETRSSTIRISMSNARVIGGPVLSSVVPERVSSNPDNCSLPRISDRSAPHHPFRGLLSVHSRYGLHACQVAFTTLYTEGFGDF
jgi:hypothetical protein